MIVIAAFALGFVSGCAALIINWTARAELFHRQMMRGFNGLSEQEKFEAIAIISLQNKKNGRPNPLKERS